MERWAPARLAYDWDRAGLAAGDPAAKVSRVLTCLSVTRAAVDAAVRAKAEMIVAHHPPIWTPLASLRADRPETQTPLALVRAGIACFSAHTNLDLAPGGVNDILAARLGLEGVGPLLAAPQARQVKLVCFVPETHLAAVRDAVSAAGAGEIGEYSHCSFSAPGVGTFKPSERANPYSGTKGALSEEAELRFETLLPAAALGPVLDALRAAHPYEEPAYDIVTLENHDARFTLGRRGALPKPMALKAFAGWVAARLGAGHALYAGDPKRKVRTAAVIGGAGGSQAAAIPGDVDVLVTGDVKYHDALDAVERGLSIVDAGHQGTELAIAAAMAERLGTALPGLKTKVYHEPALFAVAEPRKS